MLPVGRLQHPLDPTSRHHNSDLLVLLLTRPRPSRNHKGKGARARVFLDKWPQLQRELSSTYILSDQCLTGSRGVAVGSTIGHALGGMFGGSSSQAAEAQPADGAQNNQAYQSTNFANGCDESAKAFTRCLEENKGEYQMNVCGWYLDQLVCINHTYYNDLS